MAYPAMELSYLIKALTSHPWDLSAQWKFLIRYGKDNRNIRYMKKKKYWQWVDAKSCRSEDRAKLHENQFFWDEFFWGMLMGFLMVSSAAFILMGQACHSQNRNC